MRGPYPKSRSSKCKSQKSNAIWTYCVVEPWRCTSASGALATSAAAAAGAFERSARPAIRPVRSRTASGRGVTSRPRTKDRRLPRHCRHPGLPARTGNEHAVTLAEGRRTDGDDAVAFGEALQNLYLRVLVDADRHRL